MRPSLVPRTGAMELVVVVADVENTVRDAPLRMARHTGGCIGNNRAPIPKGA
jgi:hypothetical protein